MAYEELKTRQSVVWGNGPYQRITETIIDIHEHVVDRLDAEPDQRWLDLACGTGAVAERAATAGADVTGVDLAPALIETAKGASGRARPRHRVHRGGLRAAPAR
jgi:2-polyprenyl-3-methyl-5-hydroxy-6-metoxy-1,4-benzoquinol methylase